MSGPWVRCANLLVHMAHFSTGGGRSIIGRAEIHFREHRLRLAGVRPEGCASAELPAPNQPSTARQWRFRASVSSRASRSCCPTRRRPSRCWRTRGPPRRGGRPGASNPERCEGGRGIPRRLRRDTSRAPARCSGCRGAGRPAAARDIERRAEARAGARILALTVVQPDGEAVGPGGCRLVQIRMERLQPQAPQAERPGFAVAPLLLQRAPIRGAGGTPLRPLF
jgi:hypothetical protein